MLERRVVEAYRWQRALGHPVFDLGRGRVVTDARAPDLWDANHLAAITAASGAEVDALLAAADRHLAHAPWRVLDTDPFVPPAVEARLARDGWSEQPATVQMVLAGDLARPMPGPSKPVRVAPAETDADWRLLAELVRADRQEGARSTGPDLADAVAAEYRAKAPACRYHLMRAGGRPVGYGALAAAPSGVGMIEDLFTLPDHRGRGLASGLIARFAAALRAQGCDAVFLGALAGGDAGRLYARLGFRPLLLTRRWVRRAG